MKPVLLATDALIFLLIALALGFGLYARRQAHLRAPWRRVMASRRGLATAIILATYLVIALLDSLHLRVQLPDDGKGTPHYNAEVVSVLDLWLTPLRERTEKTYSAPFALHLYAKETVTRPGGREARVYPRLAHGGAHLASEDERDADIRHALGVALAKVLATLLGVGAALAAWLAWRAHQPFAAGASALLRGRTALPWRTGLATLGGVMTLGYATGELAVHYHLLGTDKVGQDVFYQALKSVRTGLLIGTLTTLVMLPIALALGIAAGYFRGLVDDVIQYLYTTLNSIPGVLLIAAAVLTLQAYLATHPESLGGLAAQGDLRLLFLCIILGITSWTGLARLLRGETLKLAELDYIQAAHAFGVSHTRIITRHILPNVMHIVLISVALDFSGLVLAEAVLSYVGVGVDPSTQSFGNMINSARMEMAREPIVWWPLLAAFGFMFVLVLAANLFADAVRDAFDPRLRG